MSNVKYLNAIICEDIRQEINGKFILIGAYARDLILPQFPAPIVLGMYMPFIAAEKGALDLKIRVVAPNDVTLFDMQGNVVIDEGGYGAIPIPPIAMQLQSAGTLKFQVKQDAEDWSTVAQLEIKLGLPIPAIR